MHNVGSIFRTADAAGCQQIFLCGITPGPLDRFGRPNDALLKVALNAQQYIPWEHVEDTVALLDRLRAAGHPVYAIEQSPTSTSLYDVVVEKTAPTSVLVVGNEITGLLPEVLSRADVTIEIPMRGQKESLNVAVAFGIVAFALARPK